MDSIDAFGVETKVYGGIPLPNRVETDKLLAFMVTRADPSPGVLARASIKKGDLIFKVKDPLAIVGDTPEALRKTCDFCFATVFPIGGEDTWMTTDGKIENKLQPCTGCAVVYYCNENCRASAWEHHHSRECHSFDTLRQMQYIKAHRGDLHMLSSAKFRLLLRYVLLFPKYKIVYEAFDYCLPGQTNLLLDPHFKNGLYLYLARLTKMIIGTQLDEATLQHILATFGYHASPVALPLVKAHSTCVFMEASSTAMVGICVEPFVSYCAHDCNPNSMLIFEGNELRVRATRNISKDEEITLNRAGDRPDHEFRRQFLKNRHLNCRCCLCNSPLPAPTGYLRLQTLKLCALGTMKAANRIEDIERGIQAILTARFGYGSLHMHKLHEILASAYAVRAEYATALKICLKMFYVIEPLILNMHLEPFPIHVRASTLFRVTCLLESDAIKPPPHIPRLPRNIQVLVPKVSMHLRKKLLNLFPLSFGEDAIAVRLERNALERNMDYLMIGRRHQGLLWRYVPLEESVEEKTVFVNSMNELLAWAGIEKLEERHLV
ncbi:uncharacterized protein LY89DRAFT_714673 [Mollisia scopiformis]|uniref:Uncharacterized protein n=1 Tax=Mollisia scopiformis TaxID=149040 RepID=A0A194XMU1_MOLSC|nr:uncharacterized protein LY89DRAFT_714673 [Mollisia scopiformis]KUJ21580.1 hypothetical protein LY89DRAFT_714673 [Mollisia scopiformis]